MERTLPLPFCCKCKASIPSQTLVALPCAHPFCEQCAATLRTCQICGTEKNSIANLSRLLESYEVFKASKSDSDYMALFEEINVNEVRCPNGSDCPAKEKCKYDHNVIEVKTDEWMCPNCNISVVKEQPRCPICYHLNQNPEEPRHEDNSPRKPQSAEPEIVREQEKKEEPQEGTFAKIIACVKFKLLCCFYGPEPEDSKEAKPLMKKDGEAH